MVSDLAETKVEHSEFGLRVSWTFAIAYVEFALPRLRARPFPTSPSYFIQLLEVLDDDHHAGQHIQAIDKHVGHHADVDIPLLLGHKDQWYQTHGPGNCHPR